MKNQRTFKKDLLINPQSGLFKMDNNGIISICRGSKYMNIITPGRSITPISKP